MPHRKALPSHLRSYGLMRQTKILRSASLFAIPNSLRRLLLAPAKLALPDVISAYPSHVSGPLPRLPLWCIYLFLPTELRPSQQSNPVGAQHHPYYSNFSMGKFRGCSHSLMFKPADLSPPRLLPTAANISFLAEQPWLLHPNTSRFVTSPCPDMLTVRFGQLTVRGLTPLKIRSLVGCSWSSDSGGWRS